MSVTPSDASENERPTPDHAIPSELLENIPEDLRDRLTQFIRHSSTVEYNTGALPPPSLLAQYEPDVQRIIFEAAVENRKHRTALETRVQQSEFYRNVLGLLFGFVLALVVIVSSLYIILSGHRAEGLIGLGATVAVSAATFVYTDRQRRRDRLAMKEPPAYLDNAEDSKSSGKQTHRAEERRNV